MWGGSLEFFLPIFVRRGCSKGSFGSESVGQLEGGGGWSPCFSRPFNDWVLEEVARFFQVLYEKKMFPRLEYKLLLKEAKDGRFFVKLTYKGLGHSRALPFPYQSPLRLVCFAWEASWGKVLTLDQLKRRGRILANRCFLCEEEEETVEHLLVLCPKARMLWDLILVIVGVS